MIPKTEGVNGIIVNQGDMYGIFDIDDETLFLPCSFTKIFAIRKGGNIIYYIEFDGQQYELKYYLEELGIAKKFDLLEKENSSDSQNEENVTNTVEDTSTTTDSEVVEVEI